MRKILSILLLTACSLSTLANEKAGNYYLHGSLGLFDQYKIKQPDWVHNPYIWNEFWACILVPFLLPAIDTNITPAQGPEISFGGGYYLKENIRLEAVLIKPFLNATQIEAIIDGRWNERIIYDVKMQLILAQLRGYIDIFTLSDKSKVYVGAGLGMSNIKGKFTNYRNFSAKFKNRNNLSYTVAIGAEISLKDHINLGIEFNYTDYGKAKLKNNSYKTSIRGDSIIAKVRWDL